MIGKKKKLFKLYTPFLLNKSKCTIFFFFFNYYVIVWLHWKKKKWSNIIVLFVIEQTCICDVCKQKTKIINKFFNYTFKK